jgi:RNA polymerase sigma-70 factor (ECF subfamily)
MIEDELLKLRFKLGGEDGLRRIYEKYLDYLLSVAMAFLNDSHAAQDTVHDVFVSLAQSADTFRIAGNLKHYLATCVANRARDRLRAAKRIPGPTGPQLQADPPENGLIYSEQAQRMYDALAQLSAEQREAVVLRIKTGMKFRQIADIQNVSFVTAQARYRRGIEKLRSILNGSL